MRFTPAVDPRERLLLGGEGLLEAGALRRQFGIECFSPRLRFRKLTNRGPVWFVEAMFPGYLFTRFVYSKQHRAVEASHGIRGSSALGIAWRPYRKILWSGFNRESPGWGRLPAIVLPTRLARGGLAPIT